MKIRSYIFKSISVCRKVDSNSMLVIAVCANRLDLSRGMSKFLIDLGRFDTIKKHLEMARQHLNTDHLIPLKSLRDFEELQEIRHPNAY